LDGLLEQAVEEHAARAGSPAVEAEGELVQVGLQVPGLDAALVGAQQSALHQGRDAMHAGEQLVGVGARRGDRLGLMGVLLPTGRR
jgi:hypothetical protein